ncbi:hypothetical protein BC939DRAFT_477593 [Gamsiella multidivaricata]|uniref:uncharacterized protein n=1 Tax=Gamsiella multidivaricata TaxID=101098 RepID=UPI0022209D55|nr:uncharacterized protein BC939DRAFT_477593 [Gamsiella multidivaricata]KAI7822623.1 hypothetical protein BC939DRAFT_477593 [Gamsiella multidivaricata]
MSSNDEKPSYYELLCVDPGANKDDIKKAYRKQALLFHPDKMKPHMKEEASQHFQLISEAYEVLSDDNKRELYDRYGHEGVKAGGDPNPQPEAGFGPNFGHREPSGFGFETPFFASFGMPAHQYFQDQFAGHHQQFMRNFGQQMGSTFGSFGMFGPPPPPPHHYNHHLHHHQGFHNDPFMNDFFRGGDSSEQFSQPRPTLFSTSPFAARAAQSAMFPDFGIGGGGGGGGSGGFSSSSTSSSSFSGGIRTSTKTTVVNGQRTTITEVTDAQGVTTKTIEKPDGTRETYSNGVPTAIEDSSHNQTRNLGGNRQLPILIPDDEEDHGGRHRSSGNQGQQFNVNEPIVLDTDDDEVMYEDLSSQSYPRRSSVHQAQNDPGLYHPRMGRGQTLGGSSTRSRYNRN